MKRPPITSVKTIVQHRFIRRLFFHEHMGRLFSVMLLSLLYLAGSLSCRTSQIYDGPNEPVIYSNDRTPLLTEQADSLNVITFNIRKAEQTVLAATEMQDLQQTHPVSVYLLQEMDEKGVQVIAKELNLNYLYYPIVFHKKNIGNAILAKGRITRPEKLILPHSKWMSKRLRDVTIAEVTLQDKKILVYSVHTETMMMSRENRMDQIDVIIQHAKAQLPRYKYILIGGDFNTLFTKDARSAVQKFTAAGYDWPTAMVGSTATAFFGLIKPRHDYLFSQGLKVKEACTIATSRSSDHFPVFATFTF